MNKQPQKSETPMEDIHEIDNTQHRPAAGRKKISMHEDVPVWYDCCSCEAEPYWAEMAVEEDNKG
jgi:hypothetical protein